MRPKIAICFSGELRSITKSIDFWKKMIEKYNMDVYGSFWETDDESKTFFNTLNPISVEYEDYESFKSTIKVFNEEMIVPESPQIPWGLESNSVSYIMKGNILSMWYKVWRANNLSKKKKYDIVIRTRTDIYFDLMTIDQNNYLNIPWGWRMNEHWKNCGGPIDMFAYGNPEIMDYYSCLFLYLTRFLKEGEYFFPAENILKSHLRQKDIEIRLLPCLLFRSSDDSCFNEVYGVTTDQFIKTNEWNLEMDPTFSFYKK